jgi:2EXR family
MDSSAISDAGQLQDLALSSLPTADNFQFEGSKPKSTETMEGLLQNMQTSAIEIESQTEGHLKSKEPIFDLFPRLPPELRVKIWKIALPGPRIVEVYLDQVDDLSRGVHDVIRVSTPPPVLMHVNFESRMVAREKYWLPLNECSRNSTLLSGDYAFIDPSMDTVFVSWSPQNQKLPEAQLANGKMWSKAARESIRLFAMDERAWCELAGDEGFVYFENLEKFTIVDNPEPYELWHDGCGEKRPIHDKNLTFVDMDDEEQIRDLHLSVEGAMRFDNRYYNRSPGWRIPIIEVKGVAKRGKKCPC